MNLPDWNRRYRSGERAAEDWDAAPTPLVERFARELRPGAALDLACGSGRNALFLAEAGWRVKAVDGAPAAIELLRQRSAKRNLPVETAIADLEAHQFAIDPDAWDLILDCYYLQRDLFPAIRQGVRPGGLVIAIVHIAGPGEEPNKTRAARGELRGYFDRWEILHDYEGPPGDPAHRRAAAEIVARRPVI